MRIMLTWFLENKHILLGTFALAVCIRWLYRAVERRRRFIELVEKLPGPKLGPRSNGISSVLSSEWWLAHAQLFVETIGSVPGYPDLPDSVKPLLKIANECQDYGLFRFWMFSPKLPFSLAFVFIHDPQLSKQFLSDPIIQSKVSKEKRIYDMSRPVVGNSFLSLPDGKEWKHQRKLAAAGFHQRFLEFASTTAVNLLVEKVFPIWDAKIDEAEKTTTTYTLEAEQWSTRMVLEVLGRVAFSCSFGGLDQNEHIELQREESLYEIYQVMLSTILRRSRSPPILPYFWLQDNIRFRKCCRRLDSTIEDIVRKRLADGDKDLVDRDQNRKHEDLLSYLMIPDEQGNRLSYQYLFGNTRMFLFAGHDTTSAILSNALWELATHPEIQSRLQAELDPLFDATGNRPSYKDLMQLKYLDAAVKEALRLHASVGIARQVNEDVKLYKGDPAQEYVLPKGTYVYVFPMFAHRLDQYYMDALDFSPERFLGTESAKNTKNWYPFSWGLRNCVGQPLAMAELKTILAHVLRRYKLSRNPNAIDPIPLMTLTIKPHAVSIDIQKRAL